MKVNVTINPYPYINILITKIIYLMRMISISNGDVVLIDASNNVKFIVFVACLLGGKTLFIVKREEDLYDIKFLKTIGTILYVDTLTRDVHLVPADLIVTISQSELFNQKREFHFLYVHSWTEKNWRTYRALQESSFKDERKSMKSIFLMRFKKYHSTHVLVNKVGTKTYVYDSNNIEEMLNAIDSEFIDTPSSLVRFTGVSFDKGFIYMLYFFLRGDLVDIGDKSIIYTTIINHDSRLKEILFFDNDTFNKNFHKNLKYTIYSNWTLFLNHWKITKWITKFTYDYAIREKLIGRKNYELIIINKERSLDKSQFLDHTRTHISTIWGTPADGYTLSINRYSDKKLKVIDSSFRIMDKDNSINIQTDTINNICISGSRINESTKDTYIPQSKSDNELYYVCDVYGKLDGEIITIKADLTDIYYDRDGNIATDIGTRKRSLMAIPYLLEVDMFKVLDKFVVVVDLDRTFIKYKFETPTLRTILIHLNQKVIELNDDFHKSEEINEIFVSKKFFSIVNDVQHIITKEDFIRLLNQQPSNYLERFLKAEEYFL